MCLPSTICNLSSLQHLNLYGCSNLKEFPSSIEGLTTLNSWTLKDCMNLVCLPSTICSLSSLQRLDIFGCSNFDNLSENLGNLKGLCDLDLIGIAINEFPSSIEGLTTLN